MGAGEERRILVTGALGQIGMELIDALIAKFGSDNIIATDIREPENDYDFNFEKLDVLNKQNFEQIIVQNKINQVYHLAAILSATGEKNPELCWKINMD